MSSSNGYQLTKGIGMYQVPMETVREFDRRLDGAAIPPRERPDYRKWMRFYRHVLGREFGKLEGVVRAKWRPYVSVVLSRAEVEAVLSRLEPPYRLVGLLLYGCGLRLCECLGLRVHCFNLDAMLLTVHDGKGQKDRTVPLPERVLPEIREQMQKVRRLHAADVAAGYNGVFLPRQPADGAERDDKGGEKPLGYWARR